MEIIKKPVETNFLKTELGEFNLDDVMELLEDLEDADGFFNVVVIYNHKLGEWLESKGAAFRNARGSYAKGKNYKEIYDAVYKLVNEYYEE